MVRAKIMRRKDTWQPRRCSMPGFCNGVRDVHCFGPHAIGSERCVSFPRVLRTLIAPSRHGTIAWALGKWLLARVGARVIVVEPQSEEVSCSDGNFSH
ncbi:hypothetical protein ACVWYQ_004147 [Bradyrhizobium sp. USDA 3397]